MRSLVVYAHPNPRSFNAALRDTVIAALEECGDEVRLRDLYALAFDPVLTGEELAATYMGGPPVADTATEQEHLLWADRIVLVHPVWWMDRPAILKGWIDRVVTHGVAYALTEEGPVSLLRARQAVVVQTTGSPGAFYEATGLDRNLVETVTAGMFSFLGIHDARVLTHFGVRDLTVEAAAAALDATRELIMSAAADLDDTPAISGA